MQLNLSKAILLLLIVLAVLTGASYAIQQINPAELPQDPLTQNLYQGLVYVFVTSASTPLWVFLRNVYGYLGHKYGDDPGVNYEAKQFTQTYIIYEGYIKGYTVLAMTLFQGTPVQPYVAMVAGGFAFVTDLIRSSIKDAKNGKTSG